MKKVILLLAVTALAFTSCKKEEIEPTPTPEPIVVVTPEYSVSFAAFDLPGFDNNLIVVFNSDTLGNLQDAQIPDSTDYETIYLAGNTISGELSVDVELNQSVSFQLIDSNGDVAMSYSGTMVDDVYSGGQSHLTFNSTSSNVNSSSLVGGLTHTYFEAVDMEFKYSIVFTIGN